MEQLSLKIHAIERERERGIAKIKGVLRRLCKRERDGEYKGDNFCLTYRQ